MKNRAELGLGNQDRILTLTHVLESKSPCYATGFEGRGVRSGNAHVESTTEPVLLNQSTEGAIVYNGPLIQSNHARAQFLDVTYIVAGEKERCSPLLTVATQVCSQLALHIRVETNCGLVEEEHARSVK